MNLNRTGVLSCILVLALLLLSAVLVWTPGGAGGTQVVAADITVDTTWTAAAGPYMIKSNVHVVSPAVLTIEAGTNVRFDNMITLTVDAGARLVAQGNQSAGRIVFNASAPGGVWAGIVLQSADNVITDCNLSDGSPCVNIVGSANTVSNSTFLASPLGVSVSGKGNKVVNCEFGQGTQQAVKFNFGTYNSIEGCRILGADTGIGFLSSSNNNYVNATTIVGGTTSIEIDGSSNIQVNGSAFLNNRYCIQVTGTALLNKVKNSTMLVSTDFAIKTNNPVAATHNFWGITDPANIAMLVSGSVDTGSPLSADPVGLSLPTVAGTDTWTSDHQISGGLLVSGSLTVAASDVVFSDQNGYNFMYVTGTLNLQSATVDCTQESCTLFFAPGSTGTVSASVFQNGFSVLGYTSGLKFTGTEFQNGSTALVLRGGSGAEVSNCTFTDNQLAVSSSGSTDLVFKDNTVHDTVVLSGADSSEVSGNAFDTGVLSLSSSRDCLVAGNNFSGSNDRALTLSSCSMNLVTGNTFYKNKEGVRINPGSTANTVTGNEFVDNSDAPVYIFGTDYNFIYHNNIYGAFLFSSLDEGINFWNNTLGEGNHWSSYLGADDGSGGRALGDGIGDTFIPFMGVDNFPFLSPFGWFFPKTPVMDPLGSGVNTEGAYNVTWQTSANSQRYVVQESVNDPAFGEPSEVYNGTGTLLAVSGKDAGRYYYRVKSGNSMGYSAWSPSVNILVNKVPEVSAGVAKVELSEDGFSGFAFDLATIFSDPDGDALEFSFDAGVNVTVELNETGWVNATSAKADWNGQEEITFYATDGMFTVNRTVLFVVLAVNDPPGTPVITLTPPFKSLQAGELTNLSASCADIDSANLTFTWTSNRTGVLGTGPALLNLDLPTGTHLITLNASDGEHHSFATVQIIKFAPPVNPPDDDDDEDDTGSGKVAAVLAVVAILVLIAVGVVIYFYMRKRNIEAAEELSKEQAQAEKETKMKKIKKVAAKDDADDADLLSGEPGEELGPEIPQGDGVPDIGPAVGPVMEGEGGPADGGMSPEEKQKMLDELDELLFADEISEEEYIQRVNEIEGM